MSLLPQLPQHMKVKMKMTSWRGPNIGLMFSVARLDCGEVILVGPMNLINMVESRFKFMMDIRNKCTLLVSVSFKKHQKSRNSMIFVKVSYADFVKECLCADDWTEYIKLEPAIELFKPNANCMVKVCHQFLTFVEVNITMREVTPKALPVYRKLSEDTTFTDFNLKAEDGTVAVHRVILGMHSDVFLAMLNGEWKETVEGVISLNGVTRQMLQHLKDYMYLSTLPEELPQLQQLLLLADYYMVDNLKTDCIVKLVAKVTPQNFDALVEFACQNNVPDLVKAIVTDVPDKIVYGIQKKKLINRPVAIEDM